MPFAIATPSCRYVFDFSVSRLNGVTVSNRIEANQDKYVLRATKGDEELPNQIVECPITAFAARQDDVVYTDEVQEWTKPTK